MSLITIIIDIISSIMFITCFMTFIIYIIHIIPCWLPEFARRREARRAPPHRRACDRLLSQAARRFSPVAFLVAARRSSDSWTEHALGLGLANVMGPHGPHIDLVDWTSIMAPSRIRSSVRVIAPRLKRRWDRGSLVSHQEARRK